MILRDVEATARTSAVEELPALGQSLWYSNIRFDAPIHEAYERLLLDVMRGEATLFWRRDEVEHAWEFLTPILEAVDSGAADLIRPYDPESTGPREADDLLAREGRAWRRLA